MVLERFRRGSLLYLNEPDRYTVPLGLKMFIDQDSVADYGGMVAMSLVAPLPVLSGTSGLKG